MPRLAAATRAAWDAGRTPLLVDATGDADGGFSPLETYFSYSGDALIEVKRYVVEVNMKKQMTLEQARAEWRGTLLGAMKHGHTLALLLANSAPPLRSRFCHPGSLPFALLEDAAAVAAAGAAGARWEGVPWAAALLAPGELLLVHADFKVLAVTRFSKEDYAEFLGDELPLGSMQHILVRQQGP